MDEQQIANLKRGDRLVTRAGSFGGHAQDYFVLSVSSPLAIAVKSANSSENLVAREHELKFYDSEAVYTLFTLNDRWYVDWEGKKGGPDLLDSVELPTHCLICDGVRSVNFFQGEPLCINCRHKVLDDRICDCSSYGNHIAVFCDRCGAPHSTKNIQSIGARSIFGIYQDSCGCRDGWYFHDCKGQWFVGGRFVDGKFVPWMDKFKKGGK